jgi:hypothetical protein
LIEYSQVLSVGYGTFQDLILAGIWIYSAYKHLYFTTKAYAVDQKKPKYLETLKWDLCFTAVSQSVRSINSNLQQRCHSTYRLMKLNLPRGVCDGDGMEKVRA